MKIVYKIFFLLLFSLSSKAFAYECKTAGVDANKFLQSSVGQMIKISHMKISVSKQKEMMGDLISNCADTTKIAKRILGRSKWNELNEVQQDNFTREFKKYFVEQFGDLIFATVSGSKSFTLVSSQGNRYTISVEQISSSKKPLLVDLIIDKKNEELKIVDGKFADVSLIETQKQYFEREYDKNPDFIKNFKAKDHIKKK